MILIFAVDNNWNIGYKGDMLYKISKDLKRFRRITEGNIIIMGRKTFESLPDKKPLLNRINIVITRNKEYKEQGIIVINSVDELYPLLNKINPNNEMENFIIGGGEIARQTLDKCHKAYITKIYKTVEKVDTSMPNLDLMGNWKIVNKSRLYKEADVEYQYIDYIKV